MELKNKISLKGKKSPSKHSNRSVIIQQKLSQKKFKQSHKYSKSVNSLHSKKTVSLPKSKNKLDKSVSNNQFKPNISIQKQYTKETYSRVQHRLNIFTKIQQLLIQIKQRQAKLQSFFKIYRILQQQIGQQRCLQHNNDLSLYCLNDNKVLCVYCIYGINKHKTHKVLPLKDCGNDIAKDIMQLQRSIQLNKHQLNTIIKTVQNNEKIIQNQFRFQIKQLQKDYHIKIAEIQKQFSQNKKCLKDYYQQIINKNCLLSQKLKRFDKNIGQKLTQINNITSHNNQSRQNFEIKDVSKQTILSKISQLSNVTNLSIDKISPKQLSQSCHKSKSKNKKKSIY